MRLFSHLARDRRGATAVEFSLLGGIMIVGVVSLIDLGHFVFRWNEQAQAAKLGARLAATHNPVSSDLASSDGLFTGAEVGEPAGTYVRACAASSCSPGSFSSAAFNRIFYGADAQCGQPASQAAMGVCDAMPDLQPSQLSITYRNSGVDVIGTEGSLRPLITVRLSGAPSKSVMLATPFPQLVNLPATEVTVLAEDMRTSS
jgi:Flp pilus assembly pilin Flp